jgi:uncharacterized protein YecE (DUF72 family)
MARFYIGTAGWSYKDWEGTVYPLRRPAAFHALVFLIQYINLMEINSTFYRPPRAGTSLSWIKRIPENQDFAFSVKLHRKFTHQIGEATPRDADEFKLGIEPIRAKRLLGALLMQFPWSFANTPANLDYLQKLFGLFEGYPLALEVRHESWDRAEFFRFLETRRIIFCNIDQPVIGKSLAPTARVTNPEAAYVRLHGRNYQTWFKQGAGRDARYNYLYSDTELDEWVDRIRRLGAESGKVYVVTNNHYRGQALANALQLKNKLSGEKLDIPRELLKSFPVLRRIVRKIERGQLDLFDPE